VANRATARLERDPTVRLGAANTPARDATVEGGGHPTVRHAVESMLLEERTRWAMQIHDGLTQSVTSAVLELQTLRHRIKTDPDGAITTLDEIEHEIREDLRHIRELLFEMTQDVPAHDEATLVGLVRDFAARWRLPGTVQVTGDLEVLDETTVEAAYSIVSEALANAAKHSGAPEVHVVLVVTPETLHVEVQDRGRGMVAVTDDDPHFGIRIMRARAEALGGSLDMTSTPGHGTTVVAELPVTRAGEGR
jgi:two-component system nitrate/nitrite sensor histidine kinase NarX